LLQASENKDFVSPKYLNSPETDFYHKGELLYGLYEARRYITKSRKVIIVEGYLDVLSLASQNITNAVGVLGTALTEKQLGLLYQLMHLEEIIFCFDQDQAGQKAAWRALHLCLKTYQLNKIYKFCQLPPGEDPDSCLQKYGVAKFLSEVNKAQPLSRFWLTQLSAQVDCTQLEGRLKLMREGLSVIETMPDPLYYNLLVKELSNFVGFEIQVDKNRKLLPPKQVYQSYLNNQSPQLSKFPGNRGFTQNISKYQKFQKTPIVYPVVIRALVLLWYNPSFLTVLQELELKLEWDMARLSYCHDLESQLLYDFIKYLQSQTNISGRCSYNELKSVLPRLNLSEAVLSALLMTKMSEQAQRQEFIACIEKIRVNIRQQEINQLLLHSGNFSGTSRFTFR